MDDKGNIYLDPSDALVKELKLKWVTRPLTEREVQTRKIGRNSPCGCGSGIKFKKCCYGKESK
jgi:uncharacterized protein YchJ